MLVANISPEKAALGVGASQELIPNSLLLNPLLSTNKMDKRRKLSSNSKNSRSVARLEPIIPKSYLGSNNNGGNGGQGLLAKKNTETLVDVRESFSRESFNSKTNNTNTEDEKDGSRDSINHSSTNGQAIEGRTPKLIGGKS